MSIRELIDRLTHVVRRRSDSDFRAEAEAHIALEADRLVAQRDLASDEARFAAKRAFGNVTAAQERFYEAGRWAWLDRLQRHLAYAVRGLRQRPVFAAAAIVTLAIGIGFNASIFTFFYSVAYRPLPVRGADRLVNVYQVLRGRSSRMVYGTSSYVSYAEFQRYRAGLAALPPEEQSLLSPAAYRSVGLVFDEATRKTTTGEYVSCNFFTAVDVRMAIGRSFTPEECEAPGDAPVAVISHDTWQHDLGGIPSVVGTKITLNRVHFTVVGVTEPGFDGLQIERARLWIPVTMQPAIDHGRDSVLTRDASWLLMIGHLAPGSSIARVRDQLGVMAHAFDAERPGRETRVVVAKAAYLNLPEAREKGVLAIGVILTLGALAIGVVCANVMSLLLARGLARRREMAIRLAIGASRARLVEQLFTESALLAVIGGSLGFALAFALPAVVSRVVPPNSPQFQFDLRPDGWVLAFTMLVSVVTALVFGLLPALQATDFDLVSAAKDGSSPVGRARPSRLRATIVGFQVAGSALLLIIASLLTRASARGATIDPGYATRDVVSFDMNLRELDYKPDRAMQLLRTLALRVGAIPGVEDVAFVSRMPLLGRQSEGIDPVDPRRAPDARRDVRTYSLTDVSGRFFSTMQIRLVAGRAFTDGELDLAGASGLRPAVVSESMAHRFWPTLPLPAAVGQHIRVSDKEFVIAGVAADTRYTTLSDSGAPFAYLGVRRDAMPELRLIARVRGGAVAMAQLERVVPQWASELDPSIVAASERFTARVDLELLPARLTATVAGAIGALALLLAVVGIYGVVSYAVSQRGREIAIRMALGATRQAVIRLMMKQSARAAMIGLAAGGVLALALAMVLRSVLMGVSPLDPVTYLTMSVILGGAATLAAYLPSRRAASVDAARTLRED